MTSDKHMSLRIHQGNKAAWAVKKSPVEDEVLALQRAQYELRGHLFQAVINHTVKLPRAMPALAGQLPDGVTFNNPAPEPFLFICLPGFVIGPTKRMSAIFTKPSLFAIIIKAVFLDGGTGTARTMFFWSWYHDPQTRFIIFVLSYAQSKAMTRALLAHINGIYTRNDKNKSLLCV